MVTKGQGTILPCWNMGCKFTAARLAHPNVVKPCSFTLVMLEQFINPRAVDPA